MCTEKHAYYQRGMNRRILLFESHSLHRANFAPDTPAKQKYLVLQEYISRIQHILDPFTQGWLHE